MGRCAGRAPPTTTSTRQKMGGTDCARSPAHKQGDCSECGKCKKCPSAFCTANSHILRERGRPKGGRSIPAPKDVPKRPRRRTAPSINYDESTEKNEFSETVLEDKLGTRTINAFKDAWQKADQKLSDRVDPITVELLDNDRYSAAVTAVLRSSLSSTLKTMAGNDVATVDKLHRMCAEIFSSELVPISPLLEAMADVAVRTSDNAERRLMVRTMSVAVDIDIASW